MVESYQNEEIDLIALFFELLEHWFFIGLSTIIAAAIAFAITKFYIVPQYESTAELYMLDNTTSISSIAEIQIGNNLSTDYVNITKSRPVLDTVINNLGLAESYKQLSGKVRVVNDTNTHILKITTTDANAQRAKMITDEIAKVAKTFIADKMGQREPSVLHFGYSDGGKVSPSNFKNTFIGAFAGLFVSCFIVFINWFINDSVKTEEDVEKKLKLVCLGSLPLETNSNKERKERKK